MRVTTGSPDLVMPMQMLVEGLGWPTSRPEPAADGEHWRTAPVLRGGAQRSAEDELKYQTLTLQVVGRLMEQAAVVAASASCFDRRLKHWYFAPEASHCQRKALGLCHCPERTQRGVSMAECGKSLCRWLLQLRPAPAICNPCMLTMASSA